MPVIELDRNAGRDEVSIHMFSVLALRQKRLCIQTQINVLRVCLLFLMAASLGMKSALGASAVLLFLAIGLVIYSLHTESENLKVVQAQLVDIIRNTPLQVLNEVLDEQNDEGQKKIISLQNRVSFCG